MSSEQKLMNRKTLHSKLECLFNNGYGNLMKSLNFSVISAVLDDCLLNDGYGNLINSFNFSVIYTVLSCCFLMMVMET